MENEELEKLVEDYFVEVSRVGDYQSRQEYEEITHNFFTLADKQGYMRGVEYGRDSERNRLYSVMRHLGVDVSAVIKLRKKWDESARAHDAISKLKEV